MPHRRRGPGKAGGTMAPQVQSVHAQTPIGMILTQITYHSAVANGGISTGPTLTGIEGHLAYSNRAAAPPALGGWHGTWKRYERERMPSQVPRPMAMGSLSAC